ncbi:hypothetical protein BC941DRAFT_413143 [Chlamydoabsidia padenii]|nr:hypothetical protein BC941DRAFT_413143 [Chlamydoabsidia padenii]
MPLDIYTFPPSLWASVPRLIVEEKGIPDVNYINVDLSKAENFAPDFIKLTPHHTIPVLVDHKTNQTLTDTITVSRHLDDLSGRTLTPASEQEENQMNQLLALLHGQHDVGNPLFFTAGSDEEVAAKKDLVLPFLKNRIAGWEKYKSETTGNEQLQELYKQQIHNAHQLIGAYDTKAAGMYQQHEHCWTLAQELLDTLEKTLEKNDGNTYLVGNQYTLADVHATPVLARFILIKGDSAVLGGRPLLTAYYERIKTKPNFKTI